MPLTKSNFPDYVGLVKFLIQPFLESPDSLRVDCETSASRPRVWIRIAFDDPDRGRVFGRGGRNIQAIRIVVEAIARAFGQTASLDIHGSAPEDEQEQSEGREKPSASRSRRPPSPAKSTPKLRSR